jgi:T5SS/PEP-CTERM-associated repeat protein
VAVVIGVVALLRASSAGAGPVIPNTDVVIDGESVTLPTHQQPAYKSLTVGQSRSGSLRVADFTFATIEGPARLGVGAGAGGAVHVAGPTAGLNIFGPLTVGVAGSGELLVNNGCSLSVLLPTSDADAPLPPGVADTIIGAGAAGNGTVRIDGESSSWYERGSIVIGQGDPAARPADVRNHGSLQITNMAAVSCGRDVFVAPRKNGSGELALTGGSSLIMGNLYVGGDADFAGGNATVRIAENSSISAIDVIARPGGSITLAHDRSNLDSTLSADRIDLAGGTLQGFGRLYGDVTVFDGATLRPDYLELFGDIIFAPAARYQVDFSRDSGAGFLGGIGGDAALDGQLHIYLEPAAREDPLRAADSVLILGANAITGHFANAPDGGRIMTDDGSGSFRVNYLQGQGAESDSVTLSDFRAGPISAVPLPPAAWSGMMSLTMIAAGSRFTKFTSKRE